MRAIQKAPEFLLDSWGGHLIRVLYEAGDYDLAISRATDYIESYQSDVKMYAARSIARYVRGQKSAIQDARAALRLDASSADARVAMSYAQAANREFENAVESLESVAFDEVDHSRLAFMHLRLNSPGALNAAEHATTAQQMDPFFRHPATWVTAGAVLLGQDPPESPKEAFRNAVSGWREDRSYRLLDELYFVIAHLGAGEDIKSCEDALKRLVDDERHQPAKGIFWEAQEMLDYLFAKGITGADTLSALITEKFPRPTI